jgi:cytoskeletal protein CcmA (bactofilin family)
MLNFNRSDAKPNERPSLKPAPFGTAMAQPNSAALPPRAPTPALGTQRDSSPSSAAHSTPASTEPPVLTTTAPDAASRAIGPETPGSKLIVGPNIKLKGVEISDCDVLIVEGQVEATVNSKAMQIAKPGTLKGTAVIDIAEVDGEFTGELTAHTKLVVHGTGRVSGTIRYGRLIVADGGELTGDVRRLEESSTGSTQPRTPAPESARPLLSPQPLR